MKQKLKEKCIGICTDGTLSMNEKRSGVAAKVKSISYADNHSTNCIIHLEYLVAKVYIFFSFPELHEILSDVIEIKIKINLKHSTLEYSKRFMKKWVLSILIFFITLG